MLPGPHGIGSFGEPTRGFLDRLADADQSYWQICPLGPTAAIHGNSPYQSSSTFAIEPLLIDLEDLVSRDLLSEPATEPDPVYDADLSAETVHYEAVRDNLGRGKRVVGGVRDALALCLEVRDVLADFLVKRRSQVLKALLLSFFALHRA